MVWKIFQKNLKFADITPPHKKNSRNDKTNYCPISILPNLSKVFENILYKQISEFFNKIFSKYQTGFRKGFNAQTCLVAMLDKFRKCLDDRGEYAALLTDLSKAFDCLPHDLLIAKLHAYGFDTPSLKPIHSHLTERYQRVKINNSFSEYHLIKYGVPQGSILGPVLFNIFLCDLFLIVDDIDIASYADDNTPYCTSNIRDDVKVTLKAALIKVLQWFYNNGMKANIDKCHFLSSLDIASTMTIENFTIQNSASQKLLGVTTDRHLNFNEHVSNLCKTA